MIQDEDDGEVGALVRRSLENGSDYVVDIGTLPNATLETIQVILTECEEDAIAGPIRAAFECGGGGGGTSDRIRLYQHHLFLGDWVGNAEVKYNFIAQTSGQHSEVTYGGVDHHITYTRNSAVLTGSPSQTGPVWFRALEKDPWPNPDDDWGEATVTLSGSGPLSVTLYEICQLTGNPGHWWLNTGWVGCDYPGTQQPLPTNWVTFTWP